MRRDPAGPILGIQAGIAGAQAGFSIEVGNDPSVRWLVGEDDQAEGLTGPLRDIWNPRCFGNPGKVSDTFEYVCDVNNDGGGVHTNSGIPKHAYALLDDGTTGGSWGRSIIDLTPYVKAGDQIRLRFDLGNDICAGQVGWYLDDVQVYRCP